MNFISKFINEKVLYSNNSETQKNSKIEKTSHKSDNINNLNVSNYDTPDYAKELAGYLQNDTNLDRSLLKMTANNTKKEKPVIKIKKESDKSLKRILIQFVVGIILIFFTMNYVQSQPAEKKFLDSSVQLWINTFQKILGSFGGVFTKDVNKIYLEKKEKLLNQLVEDEKKLLACISQEKDPKKQEYLNKLYMKVKLFEKQLSNPDFTPLNQFIKNYDQYNLYVYSLNQAVDKECGSKTENGNN